MKTIKTIKLSNKDKIFYGILASEKLREGGSIKEIEIELQNIIEKVVNDCWWKFTNRNIFLDLLENSHNLEHYLFNVLIPSIKD